METMKNYDMRLTDIAFKNLIVHIVIILKRSFHEQRVDYEEEEIRQLEGHMEFTAAKEVLAGIYRVLHIDITDEVYYLTPVSYTHLCIRLVNFPNYAILQ